MFDCCPILYVFEILCFVQICAHLLPLLCANTKPLENTICLFYRYNLLFLRPTQTVCCWFASIQNQFKHFMELYSILQQQQQRSVFSSDVLQSRLDLQLWKWSSRKANNNNNIPPQPYCSVSLKLKIIIITTVTAAATTTTFVRIHIKW